MSRLLFLILVGVGTFLIVLYVSRPELIKDFWLWGIGLAGPLLKSIHSIIIKIKSSLFPPPTSETKYVQSKILKTNEQSIN